MKSLLLLGGLLLAMPAFADEIEGETLSGEEMGQNEKIQAYLEQVQQPEPDAYFLKPAETHVQEEPLIEAPAKTK